MRSAAVSDRAARRSAPSLSGEALPAVMVPSGRNTGFSAANVCRSAAGADRLVPNELGPGHLTSPRSS